MDLQEFFETLNETEVMPAELEELLNKIIAITNPMNFDNDFATEEQLEALENALDDLEFAMPNTERFIQEIQRARAIQIPTTHFI